ncbi:hypothetical protein GCM10007893_24210 [Paracoccus marinus]|nr:hypothetical protein GCM10007893_24210 [Paracoccus marinus]
MTSTTRTPADAKAAPGLARTARRDVAAALRAMLRRRDELLGRRANPFRRLVAAMARPFRAAGHLRSDRPQVTPRSVAMPYGRPTLSTLGTGLAGGGGGSPNRQVASRNPVTRHSVPVKDSCACPRIPAFTICRHPRHGFNDRAARAA